jgi:predicted GNAT family acetyltransferase
MRLRHSLIAALLGCALAPATASAAATSSNWAGYIAHRNGVRFRTVRGTWVVPAVSCSGSRASYSAAWIGLGGSRSTADALEQVGTESNCSASGSARYSAWYELVPSASVRIAMTVRAGDRVSARVSVSGTRVFVRLSNLTRGSTFSRTLTASAVDTTSAEWIVEAPSECTDGSSCHTLPLANFGSVTFDSASAAATTGRAGTIVDSRWGRTKIKLTADAQRFVVARNTTDIAGTAVPSTLRGDGTAFEVTYAAVQPSSGFTRRHPHLSAGYLQH